MITQHKNTLYILLLLSPLVTLWAFSLDLYLPFIPDIMYYFSAEESSIQKANSLFMLTMAFGQLFFGPLSDKVGRFPTLMISNIIFMIGSLLCMFSPVLLFFVIGRILQALGGCGLYLSAFAYTRHIYASSEDSAKMISYLNVIASTSAITAPSLGTFIGEHYGWPGVFLLLFIMACISLFFIFNHFQQTDPVENQNSQYVSKNDLTSIFDIYLNIIRNSIFIPYTLPAAISLAGFFSLYSLTPFIYMDTFHLSKASYSLCYGSFGLAYFIGSLSCGLLLKFFSISKLLRAGLVLTVACFLSAFLVHTFLPDFFYTLHGLFVLVVFSFGINTSAGIGATMAPFRNTPGMAFALLSATKFFLAFMLSEVLMIFYNGLFQRFTMIFFLLSMASLLYVLAVPIPPKNTQAIDR